MSFFKKIFKVFSSDDNLDNNSRASNEIITPSDKDIRDNKLQMDDNTSGKQNNNQVNTLNPVEILMLSYIDGKSVEFNKFPGYWEYSYSSNPTKILKKLIQFKFVEIDSTVSPYLKNLKVDKLKEILKSEDLVSTGNKDSLIQRIVDSLSEEQIRQYYNKKHYKLTPMGLDILLQNDHIEYFHKRSFFDISIFNAHKIKIENPSLSKEEIAWKLLHQALKRNKANNDWGLLCITLRAMGKIESEKQNLGSALSFYLRNCKVELSGVHNGFRIEYIDIHSEYFFPYSESSIKLAPGTVSEITKLKSLLNLSNQELRSLYLKVDKEDKLPINVFEPSEVVDIILYEIDGDQDSLDKIYKAAEKRFKKIYKV